MSPPRIPVNSAQVVHSISLGTHLSMEEGIHLRVRFRFGVFELDPRAGELRKHGLRVRLQEQPFQVLAMLLEHPGEVLTREELQKKLWPADTFVDFDHGLNKAINKIREALSDSADSPRFVETVARRGYRFLAEVKVADSAPVRSQDLATGPHPVAEARELNVDAVVEGTVLRSGDQVRITAQLIEASTDKHLWSQSYQGELRDTLALQNQVARAIADQIRINLNPQEQAALKNVKVVNPQAYESFLKGRYFWNKRTADGLKVALAYFNQAIDEDPKYAQAYSGLADTYSLLGDWQYAVMTPKEALPKAKAAAAKALELDSALGEAHNSLAFCLDGFDWDFDSAGKEFRRGIELNPGYATAHHWYAWHLSLWGQYDDAIAEMRKAESLDPLSLIINADLAELLVLAHSYDESIRQSRKTIEMDPNFALAHNQLAQAYLQKHMNDEAVAELQEAAQLSEGSPTFIANLACAYASSGKRSEAIKLLSALKKRSNSIYSHGSEIAVIYAALGDTDQAMNWLEKGFEERFNPGVLLRPGFDPLRSDPRFQDLLRRIGLPR